MSYSKNIPTHSYGDPCPACGCGDKSKGGKLHLIKTKDGSRLFLGCNRYPNCKYTVSAYYTSENLDLQIQRELEEEERELRNAFE